LKFLVVGLGNPGSEYEHTRHNIGFDILDQLAANAEASFISGRHGAIARIRIRGRHVLLLKPSTFMNLSGKAVNYWLQQEHIQPENLLVVTDDLALTPGAIRIRLKGSDGGHNGLKSIQETLNHSNFARMRFGIGNDFYKGGQADYVLDAWPDDQKKIVDERIGVAVQAIRTFIGEGPVMAMNTFNRGVE
jgi:PTH1 family peptidyl-tRNA hydrolase